MAQADVIWKEVIRPPLWLLAFIYFMFLSLVLAVWAAFDNQIALMTWIAMTLLILFIAVKMQKIAFIRL
jgi:quinol-cytochrome oxidoreductase complex cytochrome b subunit